MKVLTKINLAKINLAKIQRLIRVLQTSQQLAFAETFRCGIFRKAYLLYPELFARSRSTINFEADSVF